MYHLSVKNNLSKLLALYLMLNWFSKNVKKKKKCVKIDSLVRKSLMYNLLSLNILNIIDVHSILWGDKSVFC